MASPVRFERTKASLRNAAEIQRARDLGADRIRIFQRRDRSPGRPGRGLRAAAQALGLLLPAAAADGARPWAAAKASRASAHFTASLGRRFPRTHAASLTRSFARHPALLTRAMMVTVHGEEFFDGFSAIRRCRGSRCHACTRDARLCGDRDSMVACDDRPEQRRRGQARQRFQRLAERLQDRPDLQGQLRRHAECRDRGVPGWQRARHHAGVRGRNRDHDGGQGRHQAGLRTDEGSRARPSIPNPICRRSPDTTRPRRARCCRFRSIRRAW